MNLLALKKGGTTGPEIAVTENGEYTLPGFNDSAVTSLTVRIQDYTALKKIIRESYNGRLVDILDIQLGSLRHSLQCKQRLAQ